MRGDVRENGGPCRDEVGLRSVAAMRSDVRENVDSGGALRSRNKKARTLGPGRFGSGRRWRHCAPVSGGGAGASAAGAVKPGSCAAISASPTARRSAKAPRTMKKSAKRWNPNGIMSPKFR